MNDEDVAKTAVYTIRTIAPECGDVGRPFDGRVTALIPCYGKAAFVELAVSSCLRQTVPFESVRVLLMDEASAAMKEALESMSPKITCYVSERLDPVTARNALFMLLETDWLVFLDGDDELEDNFLEELSKTNGAIRYGLNTDFLPDGQKWKKFPNRGNIPADHPAQALCQNMTCLMHRDVYEDLGLDPELAFAMEDTDFVMRLLKQKKWLLTVSPDTGYFYRLCVPGQLTSDSVTYSKNARKLLLKHGIWLLYELKSLDYDGLDGLINDVTEVLHGNRGT